MTRQVFTEMLRLYQEDGTVNSSRLMAVLSEPRQAALVSEILNGPERPGLENIAEGCIRALLKRRAERRIRELPKQIQTAAASGDVQRADELEETYIQLQREVQAL